MTILERYSTNNDCYKANVSRQDSRYVTFQTQGPKGLMLHSVGTPQPNARVFADSWNKSGYGVAVHGILQADGTVYQCLPWNFRGWHAGGSANNTHVGIEMTEPAEIAYTTGAAFTCTDFPAARAQAEGCYLTAVALFARLCTDYQLDPMQDIVSHAEGYRLGIASGHGDPEHLWEGLGLPYTMDTFRQAVKAQMSPLYRIRRAWQDTASQVGAYRMLETAKRNCPVGYFVFDEAGNTMFENQEDAMTKQDLITLLGDKYIQAFEDLPEWAKPEVREMLDLGLIDGGTAEADDAIHMLLSDLRVAIIAYRAAKKLRNQ